MEISRDGCFFLTMIATLVTGKSDSVFLALLRSVA